MFNKRSQFKKKKLNQIQEMIWGLEMANSVEEDAIRDMEVNLEKIRRAIEMEKEFCQGLADSTKYEDRQTRKASEDKISKFNRQLEEQEKAMQLGRNKMDRNQSRIDTLRWHKEVIGRAF